jgi:catechol 2,3-dioxygenase-like lactoylglutathione lyase family enzyme
LIRALHGMLYSSDPEATRGFLRDVLELPATDVGQGWLIFQLPTAELGSHPVGAHEDGQRPGSHELSFVTDDVRDAVERLRAKGVDCAPITDRGYGLVTSFAVPGGITVDLYQPAYEL